MKVAELIEKLKTMPQDLDVFCVDEYEKFTQVKHADALGLALGRDPAGFCATAEGVEK